MKSTKYISGLFVVFAIASLTLLIYFTGDIEISIYYLSAVIAGILSLILITRNPLLGLLLIIMINHFDDLIQLPVSLTAGRFIGITVAVGWFLNYFLSRKTKFFQLMDLNGILLLLTAVMIISSLLASYPGRSLIMVITLFLLILMVFFIQDFISDKNKLNILVITIALSVGIASLIGIIQYKGIFSGDSSVGHVVYEGEEQTARMSGFQKNPNGYGILLMSGIPLLLFLSVNCRISILRKVSLFFFLTSIVSLTLTLSRTHIIEFIIFFFTYMILNFKYNSIRRKQLISYLMIFVILISTVSILSFDAIKHRTFDVEDITHEIRYDILLKGIKLFKENPLFGIGFGNFELLDRVNPKFSFIYGKPGHEIISDVFVSVGICGSLILIVICYKTLRYLNTAIKYLVKHEDKYLLNLAIVIKAAFVGLLCTFFGDGIIFQRIFWIYVALAVIIFNWTKNIEASSYSPVSVIPRI